MKEFDYEKYNPVCECGWKIEDDVYYQVKDSIPHNLNVDGNIIPIPLFTELKIYPVIKELTDGGWSETHYCPKCEKEYVYILPMREEDEKTCL